MPEHWESYQETQRRYQRATRLAKINSWGSFFELANKVPEPPRLRKILTRDRRAMEKPLRLAIGNLNIKVGPGCTFGNHFPGTWTDRGSERSLNITKSGTNSVDWHMARIKVTENRVAWAVVYIPCKHPEFQGGAFKLHRNSIAVHALNISQDLSKKKGWIDAPPFVQS